MSQAKYLYCFIDTDKRSLFIKNRLIHTISSVRQQHLDACIQQKHFEHFKSCQRNFSTGHPNGVKIAQHTISGVRQQHLHTCIQQKHFEHF